ncbi:hypothetical protein VE02_01597 [Pseudogymnoascus sp. 03VT05]|nr:hypothetical protein VE02_01597 [Pseudogymnoascus sp. 03VT05]
MEPYYYAHISPAAARPHQFEGKQFVRQMRETVEEFLQGLPPATTKASVGFQWIWISNPNVPPHQFNPDGTPRDEWSERVSNVSILRMNGEEMLNELKRKASVARQNLPQESVEMISVERDRTIMDIKNLAIATKTTTGKVGSPIPMPHTPTWMLFSSVDRVDHIWSIVAHAVATNQLGPGATVSPKLKHPETGSRLICIYTYDFSDTEDIIRGLHKLRELGLVAPNEWPPRYYNCDAYTYLEIHPGNQWGIPLSLYSSEEML